MLAAWGRIKYPHIFDGVIAGSAPIWMYEGIVRYDTAHRDWLPTSVKSRDQRRQLQAKLPSDVCQEMPAFDACDGLQDPPYDDKSFAKTVTKDASPEAGSAAACVPNMRKGWQVLFNASGSECGRKLISDAMNLCPHSTVDSKDDAVALALWLQNAWDNLAMVCPSQQMYVVSTLDIVA